MEKAVEIMRVRYWWESLIVGMLAILLGIWSLVTPLPALRAVTILFIISFFISGIIDIAFALSNRRIIKGWGWVLTGGIIDLLLALMLLGLPAPAATIVVIYFIGFWILFRSIWAIGSAAELNALGVKGWGWLLALAILSLIFAIVFIFSSPIFGGTVIVAFFATAMIIYGIFRIDLAFQLKRIREETISFFRID